MTRGVATSHGAFGEAAVRRALIGSFFGTGLETYDFFLFGFTAGLVFNRQFFPTADPLAGTLLAFATLAVGFVARPFGGIIIANYGDKIGRKPMLLLTLGAMGVVTALIGLLPTYPQIGILAPILLTTLRFVQGIAFGGEWTGAILVVVEHAPPARRGYFGGFANGGTPLGSGLACAVISLALYATGDQFLSWGWRIPFLISVAMIGIGIYVRTRIVETPEFLALKREGRERPVPILDAARRHYREILLTAGAVTMTTTTFLITSVFILTYGSRTLGISIHTMLHGLIALSVVSIVASVAFGALSDRIGRVPVVIAGVVLVALCVFPLFWLVQTKDAGLIILGLALFGFVSAAMHGPVAAFYTEIYDTSVRYSGATLGTQIGIVLGGGFSPLIATALLAHFGGATWPICLYVIGLAVVAIPCFWALGASRNRLTYAVAD
jgi:MHS family shikimate/dehydroshikimate transporter-like MFS transporter